MSFDERLFALQRQFTQTIGTHSVMVAVHLAVSDSA